VKLRVSARARREADRRGAWWGANRANAQDLFTRELLHVLDLLRDNPDLGIAYEAVHFGVPVRRLLMPKTETHVYYARVGDAVVVLAVWGARRRRGPKL
jgi:plasmid stabilization system protein ParE